MESIKDKLIRLTVEIDNAGFSKDAAQLDSVIKYSNEQEPELNLDGPSLLTDPGEVDLVKLIVDFLLGLVDSGFTEDEVKAELDKILNPLEPSESIFKSIGDDDAGS